MITKDVIKNEVEAAYSDPAQQSVATSAYNIGLEWVGSQPVSWNKVEDNSKADKRAARLLRKRQKNMLWNHIYDKMVTEEEAAKLNDVQVVGFGFIALAIISGIISWVVKRLLDAYFVSGDLDAE
jgi:hypothetical protein